jgi:hypothetical protein
VVRGDRPEGNVGRRSQARERSGGRDVCRSCVKEAMAKQGNVINVSTSDFARDFFKSELAKYSSIVKKAGIEPQ